ncbi:hypothetical protein IFM89_008909 [Coptis chinensis]|uniref:Uncharacterized protein n=1 Tax=Coptis chinensis TaxID=261450 RepID=A0A835LDU6_9MAGN|nr:hypothetical protein IFM89_008909 [Coptis chinensis]
MMMEYSSNSSNVLFGSLKRYWKRRKYQRLESATKSKSSVKSKPVKFAVNDRKLSPESQEKNNGSRGKTVIKLRDAYVEMMLGLSSKTDGETTGGSLFGAKRMPKAREVRSEPVFEQNERKVLFEMYSILVASRELDDEVDERSI